MADRYWVGGSANWDGTAGTKWATTSGGAGGAAVPTTSDDVYFDANSGAVTVTVSAASRVCRNLDFTGFTGTFTGTATITNISGNLTLGAGMTWTHTGAITFQSSSAAVITSNGIVMDNAITVNKASGSWTLADAFDCQQGTTNRVFTLTAGSFDTAGYDFKVGQFGSNNTNVRSITLGASNMYFKGLALNVWTLTNVTNLTINTGTAHFITTGVGTTAQAIGFDCNTSYSIYKITRTGAHLGDFNVNNCVCADFNLPSVGVAHNVNFNTGGNNITLGSDLDIGDVANPTRGILSLNFGSLDTNGFNVRVGRFASSNSNVRSFTMTSGDLELCGDTGIWNTATQTNLTINMGTTHVKCVGTSNNTRNFTAGAGIVSFYRITRTVGSTSSGSFNFQGVVCPRVNMPATGVNHAWQIASSSDVKLESDCVIGTTDGAFGVVVSYSIFDTDGYDITAGAFQSTAAGTRTIYLRDSVLNLYGNANASPNKRALAFQNAAGLTFNCGTSVINFLGASGVDTEFQGAGNTFYKVVHAGVNTPLRLADSNTYDEIEIANAGETLQITDGTTQTTDKFTAVGTSGNEIVITSFSTGTHTLTKSGGGIISCDYLDIQHSIATPADTWYAGKHSINNENVSTAGSGWIFTVETQKSLEYRIVDINAVTKSLRYAVQSPVGITKGLKYTVATEPAAVQKSSRYAIIKDYLVQKSLRYSIDTSTAVTKSAKYCVIASDSVTKGLIYEVSKAVNITKAVAYKVIAPVAVTKSVKYSIVVSDQIQKSLSYYLVDENAVTKSAKYTVLAPKQITKALSYEIVQQEVITKSLKYVVVEQNQITKSVKYAILVIGNAITKSLAYFVAIETAITKSAKYTIKSSQSLTQSLRYEVITDAAVQKTSRYAVVSKTPVQKGLEYQVVQSPNAITKALRYSILQPDVSQKSVKYSVLVPRNIDKSLRYEVVSDSSVTKQIAYMVLLSGAITKSIKYTITDSPTAIQKQIQYVLTGRPVLIEKTLEYSVVSGSSVTKSIKYEVVASVSITKSLAYEIANLGYSQRDDYFGDTEDSFIRRDDYSCNDENFSRRNDYTSL